MDLLGSFIRMKTQGGFAPDSDDDDDSTRNTILMYQQIVQNAHNVHQPVPKVVTHRERVHRRRREADASMMQDYFNFNCTYKQKKFHCRFGMHRPLFLRILSMVTEVDPEFLQTKDAAQIPGHTPHMKMVAAMKMLCKGVSADSLDDYCAMGAATIYKYFRKFIDAVCRGFNYRYMRRPTADDTRRLMVENSKRGFPGMLGSIDCMHWTWKNCPTFKAGEFYSGHKKAPTVILEAVASYDRWFWHAYFGKAGSNNDINVLNQSNVFDPLLNGEVAPVNYIINGRNYTEGYYLADGIYPKYKVLVSAFKDTTRNPIKARFNSYQEAKRKDVERAFGTLKRKFQILNKPCEFWKKSEMATIMRATMIMHNMVVENEYRAMDWGENEEEPTPPITGMRTLSAAVLQSEDGWRRLRRDLAQHIWERHGNGRLQDDNIVDNPRDILTESEDVSNGEGRYPDEDDSDEDDDGNFYENGV